MVGLIVWIQVWSFVHGLKLEISIKPIDTNSTSGKTHQAKIPTGSAFRSLRSHKIVGGDETVPHSLPWQAAMISKFDISGNLNVMCGGVIICPKFVLTAGHCTENQEPERKQVVVGVWNRKALEPSITRHDIAQFHDHPAYKSIHGEYSVYDYSILELVDPIVFKPEAQAVYLPEADQEFSPDSKFLISGWGARSDPNSMGSPNKLMSVTVPWVSDEDCKAAYAEPKKQKDDGRLVKYDINEAMICAGDAEVGKIDACFGDSGGPMVWLDPKSGQVTIIGLVSFGFSCAQANAPGVYAELTTVLDWVKDTTGDCNAGSCAAGNCMTKENLHRSTLQRLMKVTKHRFRF